MEKVLKASIAGAALSGVLCGCAPNNPDSLRSDPGVSAIFESALPYEAVYENEQRGFLGCMTGSYDTAPGPGFPAMTFAIQPRIDPEKKSASIVLVHHGAWKDIWAVVDITSKEEGSTVHAYTTGHLLMKDFGDVAKVWASGSTQCQKFAITTRQYPLSE